MILQVLKFFGFGLLTVICFHALLSLIISVYKSLKKQIKE